MGNICYCLLQIIQNCFNLDECPSEEHANIINSQAGPCHDAPLTNHIYCQQASSKWAGLDPCRQPAMKAPSSCSCSSRKQKKQKCPKETPKACQCRAAPPPPSLKKKEAPKPPGCCCGHRNTIGLALTNPAECRYPPKTSKPCSAHSLQPNKIIYDMPDMGFGQKKLKPSKSKCCCAAAAPPRPCYPHSASSKCSNLSKAFEIYIPSQEQCLRQAQRRY